MINTLWIVFAVVFSVDVFFWVLRTSLANVRISHLMSHREQRPELIERTMQLLEDAHLRVMLRALSTLLHFLLAGLAVLLWQAYRPDLSDLWVILLVLLVAALLILLVEYFIEGRVLINAEELALSLIPVSQVLNWIFSPLSVVMLFLLGEAPAARSQSIPVTEDELKSWVEDDQPESALEKGERRMIYSIFQFGDTLCREIMVPRIDVLALDIHTPLETAIEALTASGHSRVPVYEDSIDNVIGVLYAKDMLRVRLDGQELAANRAILRKAYFVPEAKKVEELLAEMRARGVHIAIVVDEYGGMAGLVTLEDIVEEIVGEIRDEYDQSEELPYQQISPDEFIFQGRIDLDNFNDITGMHLVKDVADTLGGYISAQVGHVPSGSEQLQLGEWLLTVEQVVGRRIRKVRVRRQADPAVQEENGSNSER